MAHINVFLTDKILHDVVFNDAFEFIAAAGNVAHTVAVFIMPEALPMFTTDTSIKPEPAKALKSLVFYDVEDIYICADAEVVQPYMSNVPNNIEFASFNEVGKPGQKVLF